MASTIPGIRIVRCPNCRKLLTEIAELPVYKCGGCGTVLRAKNRATTLGGGTSSASLESNSQNLSLSSSMNRESESVVVRQPIPCSLEVDGGVKRVASSEIAVSNSNAAIIPDQMEECSNHAEKGIEGKSSSGNSTPADQLALGKSEMNVDAECKAEERVQVRQGHSLDEQTEKSMTQSPEDCNSSRLSNKAEQSSESVGIDAASSEEGAKLTAGSSRSYDGSVSSPDRSWGNRPQHKYLHLSKRTRRKNVADSVDSVEFRGKSLDERDASAIRGGFDSNRDGLPPRPQIPAMERDTTFGSEDFLSIQNWIGSETEGASKSLSDDLLLRSPNEKPSAKLDCLEPDHMKILRKVDELRDELSEFLTRTVEGKRGSSFRHQLPCVPFSGQPPCSSCLPPCNMYCQANLPSYLQKAQTGENGVDKLQTKEKNLAVKSYCRPVSGSAPFVICSKCWKLLLLPADFLVTPKRLHKLKCGACSGVLVFSFRPRARTAPMTPIEVLHPPSKADNNNGCAQWNPMSFSDAYGVSFVRNCSSEAEPVLHISRNSSYSVDGRDSQRVIGSRLHSLMGYSSASELLFRPPGVDEGYQSTEPSTPQFYRPSEEVMRFGWNGTGTVTPNSMEIEEEDELQERLRTRKRGSALQGLLKKGVRELSQGLESMKLKIHSNG